MYGAGRSWRAARPGWRTRESGRPSAGWDQQPCLDPPDADLQGGSLRAQVLHRQPVLVLAGPGDRSGPPGRRFRGHRPLAPGADAARPLASSRPSAHRAARSRPASDPRCRPAVRSTAWSCADTRSRVRTRAPAGQRQRTGPRPSAARSSGTTAAPGALCRQHGLRADVALCAPDGLQRPVPRRPAAVQAGAERRQHLDHVATRSSVTSLLSSTTRRR